MTVLSVCQDVSKTLKPGQTAPTSIFASSDPFARELGVLVNEAAAAIAKQHDWRKLLTLKTQAGDGTTTAFAFPDDYDRMPVKASIFSTAEQGPMEPILDPDVWLDREIRNFSGTSGYWMIQGGFLNIKKGAATAMPSTESAKYYYVSNKWAEDNVSASKASFTADTDTFRLPERLLMLALIWRYRHRKGLDYAEDMQNAEIALSQEIARDKGSRIVAVGRPRIYGDVTMAFNGVIDA